jgi:UDP-glucose 4-epimerase
MCKAISERIITSQAQFGRLDVRFLTVRYGNVLESRGSIIPLFRYQIENKSQLTLTDPEMTRFIMTLDESVDLINTAISRGESGSTWKYGKSIKITGLRPGEKKHEDLINESESIRVTSCDKFYVMAPSITIGNGARFSYSSSDNVMCKDDLRQYLESLKIID